MRRSVKAMLTQDYTCREAEGGCGAEKGEQCKTFARGKVTQPHADRWRQWDLAGSPGAWWHGGDHDRLASFVVPAEHAEFLITRIERALERAERDLAELRKVAGRPPLAVVEDPGHG